MLLDFTGVIGNDSGKIQKDSVIMWQKARKMCIASCFKIIEVN